MSTSSDDTFNSVNQEWPERQMILLSKGCWKEVLSVTIRKLKAYSVTDIP